MLNYVNTFSTFQEKTKKYDVYDFIACCFLALGVVFYQERTLYLDNAYLLFNILDSQNFRIEHYRYAAVLPQILAVLAAKIGASIPIVAGLLSFGYLFIHGIIYWLTKHLFKQKGLGVIYLACMLLAMHENFFDMVTETRLALGFGILYAAIMLTKELDNSKKLIWTIVVLILGTFSHPVFILYFGIINLFYWSFKNQVYFQHFIIMGVLYFLKSALLGNSSYEAGFYSKVANIDTFYNSFLHGYMKGHLGQVYKLVIIIVYLTSAHLYRQGLRKELAAYLFAIAGTYFLLAVVNSSGESHMMIQKSLLLLNFVCLYPMVYFYDQWINKIFLSVLIPFVLFASFWTIDSASEKYTNRISNLKSKVNVLNKSYDKAYIHDSQIDASTMLGVWALPYESIILSSWSNPNSFTLYPIKEKAKSFYKDTFRHVFMPPMPQNNLNNRYFKLQKNSSYQLIDSTFILK